MSVEAQVEISGESIPLPNIEGITVRQTIGTHLEVIVDMKLTTADGSGSHANQVKKYLYKKVKVVFSNGTKSTKFTGSIAKIVMEAGLIQLVARGNSFGMDQQLVTKTFSEGNTASYIRSIAKDYDAKLDLKVGSSPAKYRFFVQHGETDYQCLRRLASLEGYMVYDDNGESLHVCQDAGKAPCIELTEKDLPQGPGSVEIEPPSTSVMMVSGNHDPLKAGCKKLGPFKKQCSDPFASIAFGSVDKASKNKPSIYRQACEMKEKLADIGKRIQAERVSCMVQYYMATNHPGVHLGCKVKFKNHPYIKEGLFVRDLLISYEKGNQYSCQFMATPLSLVAGLPFRAENPGNELTFATVVDTEDPKKMARVGIRFPWDEKTTLWASVLATAAGKDEGCVWVPRKGHQVLVAFVNGDHSQPIVLGCLYHTEAKPALQAGKPAEEILLALSRSGAEIRLIETKNKERLILRVGEKNEIMIKLGEKPAIDIVSEGTTSIKAREIVLVAEEELALKGEKISMHATDSVALKSGKDIKLSADGKVAMSALQVNMKAQQALKQEAAKVDIEATAAAKVKGSTVDMDATAMATIKGGLVKIN